MRTLAIVNPRAGGGRTGRRLSELTSALKRAIGDIEIVTTTGPGDAARLAASGLDRGFERIVAVGGDGTLNEALNGFGRGEGLRRAVFSFVNAGTGGDFRRSTDAPADPRAAIARLANAAPRPIDVGRVWFQTPAGEQNRLFLNIASAGLPADVVERANRWDYAKTLGGTVAFAWHSLRALLSFKPYSIGISVDGASETVSDVSLIAVCNGRYFGGGMKIAPYADLSDGLFDVVLVSETRRARLIAAMRDIYSGAHLDNPAVRIVRGRRVNLRAATRGAVIPAERDGEGGMSLPARFELLPGALTLAI